jgi:hypothetical protein
MDKPSDNYRVYIDFFEKAASDKEKTLAQLRELIIKNVEQLRQFYTSLIQIDTAVIAAVIATLSAKELGIIQVPLLAYVGIVILFVHIILVVIYSTSILTTENRNLDIRYRFFERSFGEVQDLAHTYAMQGKSYDAFSSEYVKKSKAYMEEEERLDDTRDNPLANVNYVSALSLLFIFGLMTVAFSSLPLGEAWQKIIIFLNR